MLLIYQFGFDLYYNLLNLLNCNLLLKHLFLFRFFYLILGILLFFYNTFFKKINMYNSLKRLIIIPIFFNLIYLFCITSLINYLIFNLIFLSSSVIYIFINIKYFLCDNSALCNFFLFWLYILIIDLFFFNIFDLLLYSFTITTRLIVNLFLSYFFLFLLKLKLCCFF